MTVHGFLHVEYLHILNKGLTLALDGHAMELRYNCSAGFTYLLYRIRLVSQVDHLHKSTLLIEAQSYEKKHYWVCAPAF